MSAADHLNPQLFHGTAYSFEPDEMVKPTDVEHSDTPLAWATMDIVHAAKIAKSKSRMHNRRTPDDPAEPHVFEVEHLSEPYDVWGSRHVADAKGFRVIRRVGP